MEHVNKWNYKVIKKIGEGGYGEVYKCLHKITKDHVAIKLISITNIVEGVPSQVIREISLLKELNHVNIVRLLDVRNCENYVYLVFEFLDLDLHSFITNPKVTIDTFTLKAILKQILIGLAYCHALKVLHRDIKPSNILIDFSSNKVKLADFGLARAIGVPLPEYSFQPAVSFYRAPELLLGSRDYSTPIDIWAVGCIFGEMIIRGPVFPHLDNLEQLSEIHRLLGEPQQYTITELPVSTFPRYKLQELEKKFQHLEPDGFDLLSRMLCLDPKNRITVNDALRHRYLKDVEIVPLKSPAPPSAAASILACHCFGVNMNASNYSS